MPIHYAVTKWSVDDIRSLRSQWTEDQAHEWLSANQKHIRNRLIELGWEVIEDLLPTQQEGGAA